MIKQRKHYVLKKTLKIQCKINNNKVKYEYFKFQLSDKIERILLSGSYFYLGLNLKKQMQHYKKTIM